MAITNIGSYLTTMDEFVAHWNDVNAELGTDPSTDLTLQGSYTRDDLVADRANLQAAITDLEDKENDRQIAANSRDIQRDELRDRLISFRGMLKGKFPGSSYLAAAPKLMARDASVSKFLAPLDDMASLWAKVNADTTTPGFTPPLLVAGNYDLAMFTADLADLRTIYQTLTVAENDLRVARKQRDALLPPARARMIQYRTLVEAMFGDGHPLVQSLPSLSPSSSSPPPAPEMTLTVVWNESLETAELFWTAYNGPNLSGYELRVTTGPTYDPAAETMAASIAPDQTTVQTNHSLASPGDIASFRIYALLTAGGEIGSNSVTIARP